MAEDRATVVEVPYLLNDPVIVAERTLKEMGLSWKLAGDIRQGSHVKDQNPFPGKLVPKGSIVHLYCAGGPLP